MSQCLLTYAFFGDGRSDTLSEVRILRDLGLWTAEKRASWTKEATASHARLVHTQHHQSASYFAGRIAALKSRQSTPFSESPRLTQETSEATLFHALPPQAERFCSFFDCGSDAVWGIVLAGSTRPRLLLCDPCRQEWQRAECAYTTPDGWDWDEDEEMLPDLPDPVWMRLQQMKEETRSFAADVLPLATLTGFGLSNLLWPVSHSMLFTELFLVVLVRLTSQPLLRVLFLALGLTEGKDA